MGVGPRPARQGPRMCKLSPLPPDLTARARCGRAQVMSDTEHMVHGKSHGVGIYLAQVLAAHGVVCVHGMRVLANLLSSCGEGDAHLCRCEEKCYNLMRIVNLGGWSRDSARGPRPGGSTSSQELFATPGTSRGTSRTCGAVAGLRRWPLALAAGRTHAFCCRHGRTSMLADTAYTHPYTVARRWSCPCDMPATRSCESHARFFTQGEGGRGSERR